MAYEGSAIANASQLVNIGFTDFTKTLITDTMSALIDAHVIQMHEYVDFVSQLAVGLESYINNTKDDVTMAEISSFVSGLNLQNASDVLAIVQTGYDDHMHKSGQSSQPAPPLPASKKTIPDNDWGAILSAVAPVAQALVNKIGTKEDPPKDMNDPLSVDGLQAQWLSATGDSLPNYNVVYQAIAATICSNKYSLLQTIIKTGLMRLTVDFFEIETRMTFETWEQHEDETKTKSKDRTRRVTGNTQGHFVPAVFGKLKRNRQAHLTVNTAKTHHRDTSGTKVDIFARVLIRGKSDYMPLQ